MMCLVRSQLIGLKHENFRYRNENRGQNEGRAIQIGYLEEEQDV